MWDERYGGDDYAYGKAPNDFLVEVSETHLRPGSVLCLADGEGRNGVFLASEGFLVTSVDRSVAGVEKTRRLAAERGVVVDAQQGDLATFDLGVARWDNIVSIFAHLPPPLRVDVHRRVVQALRPGGALVLEAYAPAQLGRGTGGPRSLEMLMALEATQRELAGLDFEVARELTRSVIEGEYHSGEAAVTQIVGRKPG